jgi:hypothetical protein
MTGNQVLGLRLLARTDGKILQYILAFSNPFFLEPNIPVGEGDWYSFTQCVSGGSTVDLFRYVDYDYYTEKALQEKKSTLD